MNIRYEHVVYKYPLGPGVTRIPWDEYSKVVLVVYQDNNNWLPTLWVEHPTAKPGGHRGFGVIGTGETFDPLGNNGIAIEHVGSAICGSLVWHVYGEAVQRLISEAREEL